MYRRHYAMALPLVIVAAFGVTAVDASPRLLTFDDLGLPTGTIITNQYAGLGVVFSPLNGQLQLRSATFPLFPADPQGLAEIPYYTSVIIADFTPRAQSAGAWVDLGEVGPGVILEAFDGAHATGNIIASATTTSETYLGVSSANIQSIRFRNVSSGSGGRTSYLIDHFMFEPVPEPSALALLAVGALAFRRR